MLPFLVGGVNALWRRFEVRHRMQGRRPWMAGYLGGFPTGSVMAVVALLLGHVGNKGMDKRPMWMSTQRVVLWVKTLVCRTQQWWRFAP